MDLIRAVFLAVALIGDVFLVAFSLFASQPWLCVRKASFEYCSVRDVYHSLKSCHAIWTLVIYQLLARR